MFRYLNCFLSYIAMDDKDEHGFETGKAGSPLSSFYVMPAKITEEIIIVSAP